MNLLFLTDAPWCPSGYGTICRNLLPRLREAGHNITLMAKYGLQGHINYEGMTIFGHTARGFDPHMIPYYYDKVGADCLIAIFDVWGFPEIVGEMVKHYDKAWINYSPLDTDVPCLTYQQLLRACFQNVPMSKHAETEFRKIDWLREKTVDEIPLGVDHNVFKPLPNRDELRASHGFKPDDFVVFFSGDPRAERKNITQNLEGFKLFYDQHPELNPRLLLHTQFQQMSGLDYDVQHLIVDILKIPNEHNRITASEEYDHGISDGEMAELYNVGDCLLSASAGEGGGLQPLESNACGVPAVYTSFSSSPEYAYGVLVAPSQLVFRQHLAKQALVRPQDVADALYKVSQRKDWGADCLAHASNFSWDKTAKLWLSYLNKLEGELDEACVKKPKPVEDEKNSLD